MEFILFQTTKTNQFILLIDTQTLAEISKIVSEKKNRRRDHCLLQLGYYVVIAPFNTKN